MEDNNSNNGMFYPSTEWMRKKYNQFNQELFDGSLDDCYFGLITTGRGSQGGTLGRFELQNKKVKTNRRTKRLFIPPTYLYDIIGGIDIDKNNFYSICKPIIKLNGHYQATEEAWENTLVHEMCHYYNYRNGICPKQAHGPEFRQIAQYVSFKSNGRFTIQRLATAEEMKSFKLDDDMQEKKDRRIENKKAKAMALFVFKKDGRVELTMLSNTNTTVVHEICNYYSKPNRENTLNKIITSTDPRLIDLIYQSGHKKLMRTYRYWNVENKPFAKNVEAYDHKVLVNNMNENKHKNISIIIKETIEEYVNKFNDENDDSIEIAGIDLGAMSPFEYIENK